jgi:hypothetical protein
MRYRIAVWATVGLLVAGGWALYFANASKDVAIDPVVSILIRLTCPIAIAGAHYPISLYWILVANAVTYALAGFIVETVQQQLRHAS